MPEEEIMSTASSTSASRRRCCGIKGLRLNTRKFSVHRLRTKFLYIFRLFRRWRNSYRDALRHLKRSAVNLHSTRNKTCKRKDMGGINDSREFGYLYNPNSYGIRSMRHSNSFCAEAISDCLEFIKRNSISLDDERKPMLKQE